MNMDPNLTSDENLRKTLLAFLAGDSLTASEDLHVGVLNGIVHLAGIVTSIEVRVAAAEMLPGFTMYAAWSTASKRRELPVRLERSISKFKKMIRNQKYDKIFQQMAS